MVVLRGTPCVCTLRRVSGLSFSASNLWSGAGVRGRLRGLLVALQVAEISGGGPVCWRNICRTLLSSAEDVNAEALGQNLHPGLWSLGQEKFGKDSESGGSGFVDSGYVDS